MPRRKDRSNLQMLLSFMDHSPAHWWMKDSKGKYVFVNRRMADFWALSPEQMIGKTDFDLMPVLTAQAVRANDQLVIETQTSINIHEFLMGPTEERIFLTVKFPFDQDGTKCVGGIGLDVTEARRAQVELEKTRDQSLEAEALKSAFLASIQHEIRTPLAGIIGMNELLLMSNLDADQKHLAQTVQESSEALLTVLNDILDLSKIEAGRLGLERYPMNVKLVAQECFRLLQPAAELKNLKFTLSLDEKIPYVLMGDAERLRQLLMNLLSNAIKFTPSGIVETKIELMREDEQDALLRFAIKDTGIGIPQDQQAYLFMPFWQAHTGDARAYGGPGLGLPLSKHLVEKMGGDGINVQSAAGKGSTFSFEIEFPKKHTKTRGDSGSVDVLIIEDNATLAAATLKEFEALGISAESVSTCSEAITRLEDNSYRMVLCERVLLDCDANELIQRTRLREGKNGLPRVPIIVMAPVPEAAERERYLELGADDYVGKPLTTEQLWRLVNVWHMI
jgi:PAS domain S-box-containing protein